MEKQYKKGSLRKKGSKWYYRFYVQEINGRRAQKERVGTENREETQALLAKAIAEYANQPYIPEKKDISLGELLDSWIEEELRPSSRSDGTLRSYGNIIKRIKKFPIQKAKIKSISVQDLQQFVDFLANERGLSKGTRNIYCSVLRGAMRFAVFPKEIIQKNPMTHVQNRCSAIGYDLFDLEEYEKSQKKQVIDQFQLNSLLSQLENHPAILPIQIAYHTGLRLGEVCALTWKDIDFEEKSITVMRSICYCNSQKKLVLGPTKRKKIRKVYFAQTLEELFQAEKSKQKEREYENYYRISRDTHREIHEIYSEKRENREKESESTSIVVDFVCLEENGQIQKPESVSMAGRQARKNLEGLEDFHFHTLRHSFTSRLLEFGAKPKEVQELLGHSNVQTTLNIYGHASEHSKREILQRLESGEPPPQGQT